MVRAGCLEAEEMTDMVKDSMFLLRIIFVYIFLLIITGFIFFDIAKLEQDPSSWILLNLILSIEINNLLEKCNIR